MKSMIAHTDADWRETLAQAESVDVDRDAYEGSVPVVITDWGEYTSAFSELARFQEQITARLKEAKMGQIDPGYCEALADMLADVDARIEELRKR